MTSRDYEITFDGRAIPAIAAVFEDFEVTVGTGSTTLRAERMDQAALHGALDRLLALGLDLLEVRVLGDPAEFEQQHGRPPT
jgi:hypothetical protein